MKVGRIKFAIKEIALPESGMEVDEGYSDKLNQSNVESVEDEEFFEFEEVESVMNIGEEGSHLPEVPSCRFCWSSTTEQGNPLISSCQCAGTVRFIHYNCLKKWLDAKKNMKTNDNFTSIFWKSFECEICKKAYPLMIRFYLKNYSLVDYERPKGAYLVLESLN
jgi:hypothetical protein